MQVREHLLSFYLPLSLSLIVSDTRRNRASKARRPAAFVAGKRTRKVLKVKVLFQASVNM